MDLDRVVDSLMEMDGQMTTDAEAIVRHAYHTAEGSVLDVAGFVGSFAADGVINLGIIHGLKVVLVNGADMGCASDDRQALPQGSHV